MIPPPPISTLFPYTTLFRSNQAIGALANSTTLNQTNFPAAGILITDGAPNTSGRTAAQSEALAINEACDLRNRSEEHTSELQSRPHLVCRLLLEKKKIKTI